MLDFLIRKYCKSDYSQIITLWESTGLANKERGDDNCIIENTIQAGGVFYVMETTQSNEIIGTSWITNDARRLYLHHFSIKPNYQGQGLSHPLLKKSLNFAKTLNMQIKLEVHHENKIACKLYENAGFSYLGDYKVLIIRKHNL